MADKPWYHKGLRFECSECGDCCTGAPGYVWVNDAEIVALAAAEGFDEVDEFERLYIRKIGARKSLKEFPSGDCVFFNSETRKCQHYEARPQQCRSWPFWDSNLRTKSAWKETCRECPGSGVGKLYKLETIEQQRKIVKI
jgi:Fe-S-cluster containining protein